MQYNNNNNNNNNIILFHSNYNFTRNLFIWRGLYGLLEITIKLNESSSLIYGKLNVQFGQTSAR